ncbi:similar to soluble cell wall protein [Plenodomus lingam JN3]|uniref:Similar to soluble cell wall protein n=1 Tax=Leptosphaeria maculans (strain JN3 / isolate v23.1.3 / race Av1-4-5-6-7-8) TaxID=985895 RepID=E5A2Z1_LEPMJ|nr:similar to soluble cell wall protein [Plenodomus lingam JN3]CBX98004.1 similar to soluble cell wall protein [Plenodomus lingam JN3]
MKSIVLASALAAASCLLGTASGRPLKFRRALITEVVYVTQTITDAVVYVDESGAPYTTSTVQATTSSAALVPSTTSGVIEPTVEFSLAPRTTVPAPTTALPSSDVATSSPEPTIADVDKATTEAAASSTAVESTYVLSPSIQEPLPPTSSAAPPPSSSAAPAPEVPTKQDAADGRLPIGIAYDPFAGSKGSTRCKTADEIASDFARMKDYKVVRIYGMGCNIIPLAVKNAIKNGQTLMAGAYMSTGGNGEDLGTVIKTLKGAIDSYADGKWDIVQLFAVENERVNDHDMTASAVIDAINTARGQLRELGYQGPVGAVETVPAMMDNPAICKASDVVMVNCHGFFDTNTKAQDAGTFVKAQVERVKSACNTDRVVVAESGWPHQGDANGAAVPSPDNQRMALDSIRANFDSDMFIFSAFDSEWKSDWAATFNAERFWGVIQ